MSFKMLCFAPYPEDGTSQYRCWGPLNEVRRLIPDLDLVSLHTLSSNPAGTRLSWVEMGMVDAVMIQRPFAPEHVSIAHMAKLHKKPLWVDYDDDLFTVPKDNPTHLNYNTPQVKQGIEAICKMADIITVSTKFLGQKLAKFNPKVMVVPNGLNMRMLHRMDDALPRNKCVVWRGSHCHLMDLFEHTEQILAAYNAFPEWGFTFVGYNPTWITNKMDMEKRCRFLPFDNDYTTYMSNMQKLRAAVQIVPLIPIDFNFAKSRIAHIEGSFAGSAVLAPDWEEWQDGKIYRYSGVHDFQEKLFGMLATPLEDLAATNNQDWEWVSKHRTLAVTNEFRRGILEAFRRGPAS